MARTAGAAIAPLSVSSLADEALTTIVQAITSGELAPGEKLSEADLARQLGISRGPLREALGRLEGSLVTRTPRLGFSVIQLTEGDLGDLHAMREALEGMACRLAARRANSDDIAEFRALLRDANVSSQRREGYLRRVLDDGFHLLLMRVAGNARIAETLRRDVYFPLQLYRFSGSARPGGAVAALSEHGAIVDALAARDPDAAEARMREHLRHASICYQPAAAVQQSGQPPQVGRRRVA